MALILNKSNAFTAIFATLLLVAFLQPPPQPLPCPSPPQPQQPCPEPQPQQPCPEPQPQQPCLEPACAASLFVDSQERLDVGHGLKLCADHILYGYDVFFEQKKLFAASTFLGVPNQQDPQDAMVMAELISLEQPDVIIELGTNEGGGALFYASIMELVQKGRIITIDPSHFNQGGWIKSPKCDRIQCKKADEHRVWRERVTFLQGMPLQLVARTQELILAGPHERVWLIEVS